MKHTFALILVAAQALLQQETVAPYALTTDRLWATSSAVLGLIGVVIGGLALARSAARIGNGGRNGAIVAQGTGLIAAVVGALVLVTASGGPGTGNGVVGAGVALVLGVIAMTVGRLALTRSRRTG